MKHRRGLSLIELLVAVVLLATALAGLIGLWSFGFSTTRHSQDVGVAYSIARQEVERAKNIGFLMLPRNWERVQGYDGLGHESTAPNPHFTARVMMDEGVPPGDLNSASLRSMKVQVWRGPTEGYELIFETITYLTRGGT